MALRFKGYFILFWGGGRIDSGFCFGVYLRKTFV